MLYLKIDEVPVKFYYDKKYNEVRWILPPRFKSESVGNTVSTESKLNNYPTFTYYKIMIIMNIIYQ